ncbi:MAG: PKD domain-containing protein, partial [Bacteroidota bacterium]
NPKHLYNLTEDYVAQLLVMNQWECKDSITDTITIYRPPTALFSYAETCMSYFTQFMSESEEGSSPLQDYNWNFGDSTSTTNISIDPDPQHIYDISGSYIVQFRVIDENLCYDTIVDTLEIHTIPTSSFIIIDTLQQGMIYLDNTSEGDTLSYEWDFDYDNLITSTEENPIHQYSEDGTYNIMLVSTNEHNCPDTVYQLYDLLFTNLFVPNAFLPSSSNPELKTFKPTGVNIKSYNLQIYSAWGNLVFQSTRLENGAPAEGWDGTYEEEPMPTGSFIWRISAVFEDGTHWKGSNNGDGNTETNGTVALIR